MPFSESQQLNIIRASAEIIALGSKKTLEQKTRFYSNIIQIFPECVKVRSALSYEDLEIWLNLCKNNQNISAIQDELKQAIKAAPLSKIVSLRPSHIALNLGLKDIAKYAMLRINEILEYTSHKPASRNTSLLSAVPFTNSDLEILFMNIYSIITSKESISLEEKELFFRGIKQLFPFQSQQIEKYKEEVGEDPPTPKLSNSLESDKVINDNPQTIEESKTSQIPDVESVKPRQNLKRSLSLPTSFSRNVKPKQQETFVLQKFSSFTNLVSSSIIKDGIGNKNI